MVGDPRQQAKARNRRSGALGARGEEIAVTWLQQAGYTILARNWRCPYGELDVVAERDGVIVGVEVKTRTSAIMGEPEEAVTAAKQRKLALTIQSYLMEIGDEQHPYQLDVIAVRLAPSGAHVETRHYPAAIALTE